MVNRSMLLLGVFLICLMISAVHGYVALPAKRRMVVRVPFMQNPDNDHLSRIFNQAAFGEQKQKKYASFFDDQGFI